MPIAPQVPNEPEDVPTDGFEDEENDIVYDVDSDDLAPVISQLEIVQSELITTSAEADAALAAATTATATANGKNKVTFSASPASGTYENIAVGDIWFQRSNGPTPPAGTIIGSWEWTGSAWSSRQFGDAVLNSLTAGKIAAGTINLGDSIVISSGLSGRRVQLDAQGLRLFDTDGVTPTVFIRSDGGTSYFQGNITSGSTVSGATISGAVAISSNGLIQGPFILASTQLSSPFIVSGSETETGLLGVYGSSKPRFMDWIIGGSISSTDVGWTNFCYPFANNAYGVGTSIRRWTTIFLTSNPNVSSDERLKTDVAESTLGLDFIKSLRPVSYRFIVGNEDVEKDAQGTPVLDETGKPTITTRPGIRKHWGFIAQEVKQAVDASGVDDFAGWTLDDKDDPSSYQGLRYEQFIAPLTKAVQQLSDQVEALQARIAELEAAS